MKIGALNLQPRSSDRFVRERHQRLLLASKLQWDGSRLAAFGELPGARPGPSLQEFRMLGVFFAAAFIVTAGSVVTARADRPTVGATRTTGSGRALLEPPPFLLRPISKETAVELNERIPFATDPLLPARPFRSAGGASDREAALECLTAAVYYEASGESVIGQQAVAQVVLNRVRSPSFPASVCAVVYQGSLLPTGCQFSFTCDGSLARAPWRADWRRARHIAEQALNGAVLPSVGLSTHYHRIDVLPYWASTLSKEALIGHHIFYRWPGSWGEPPAFRQHYSGAEPNPVLLRATALVAHGIWPHGDGTAVGSVQVEVGERTEALGILHLLEQDAAPEPSGFEASIRAHFADWTPESLASEPSVGAGAEEVADSGTGQKPDWRTLVTSAAFRTFFRAHGSEYKTAAASLSRMLDVGVTDWMTYTGTPVEPQPVSISLAWGVAEPQCATLESQQWGGSERRSTPQQPLPEMPAILIGSGVADDLVSSLTPRGHKPSAKLMSIKRDLIYAVFARSAALAQGPDAEKIVLRQALDDGALLAPVLARQLHYFEKNRAQYPSLAKFAGILITHLPEAAEGRKITEEKADPPAERPDCTAISRLVALASR